MAQPTSYTPATDFSDDEANAVGGRSTVRTAALDAEFSALNTTLDGVLVNLALNQRDDGEIRDARVKLHTLASDVRALFVGAGVQSSNLRGDWVTATAYVVLDVVVQGGNTYICATAHTSGTFATDLAADKWILLALGSGVAASAVSFSPTATIAATSVQAAIDEADTEGRALTAAVRTDLADVSTAAKGDALVGWGAIVSIIDGVLTRHATLAAAVSAISSTRCTVIVRDDVTMAASATFPSTCTLRVENGARITTTGFTLTINGKFEAGLQQCFAGSGSVVFAGRAVPMFLPQWWGAVGDGTTDDTTAIQACITAAEASGVTAGGCVVYFAPSSGYYRITSRILVNANGTTLRGGGAGSVIYNDNASGGNCVEVGDNVANRVDVHINNLGLAAIAASSVVLRGQRATNLRVDECVIAHYGLGGDGIRLTDSFCASITKNTFGSIRGYGIHASSSANAMYIAGNRLDGQSITATCGIFIDGSGNTLIGNTVESWATCINVRAIKGGLVHGNYFETYTTGVLCDVSTAEGIDIRGNYFAATGAAVSIKISAGAGYRIGPNSYVGTHSGGAPIETTSGPSDVCIEPGQVHDDSYIVKWPTNHLALGHHLLSDNLYPAEVGYLSPVTVTGTTTETTMKTYTGVKEHWGVGTSVEVIASGRAVNTNGIKDIRLKLAGTTIATVSELAAATDEWMIHARIDIQSSTVAVGSVIAYQGATLELFDVLNAGVTIALSTTHPVITITGQLGNVSDSITLNQWKVQVIN